MQANNNELSTLLRRARERVRLSQKALATRSGISQSYIAKLELGLNTRPGRDVIETLSRSLGLNPIEAEDLLRRAGYSNNLVADGRPAAGFSADMVLLPILGRVAAGQPIFAPENLEGEVLVPRTWIGLGEERITFVVQVRGDSMVGAGVCDGDRLVVRQQSECQDGDMVVARIDGEPTVKWLRNAAGRWWLESERHPGRYDLYGAGQEWQVVGVVKHLYRPDIGRPRAKRTSET